MRLLFLSEVDWEHKHPIVLLCFLCGHLALLATTTSPLPLLLTFVALLLLERRLSITVLGIAAGYALFSFFPILYGGMVSSALVAHQAMRLALLLFGMSWVSRFIKIEPLLPLFLRTPKSVRLFYGAWGMIRTMDTAFRTALASHPRGAWREAVVIAFETTRHEPRYAPRFGPPLLARDVVHVVCLLAFVWAIHELYIWPVWIIYAYVTKGVVRDATILVGRRFNALDKILRRTARR